MEELKIVTINNKEYVVSKMVTWNNRDYALFEEIINDDNFVNKRFIGRLIIKDGVDAIELVTDETSLEYKSVSKLLFELLVNTKKDNL